MLVLLAGFFLCLEAESLQAQELIPLPGFPLEVGGATGIPLALYGGPVVADTDSDGVGEIWVTFQTRVAAYLPDGSLLPGWPYDLVTPSDSEFVLDGVAIGDISPDPGLEIAFNALFRSPDGSYHGRVYVFHSDGTLLAPWPRETTGINVAGGVVLADLDSDGLNELLLAADSVYAWRGDGSDFPGWPIHPGGGAYFLAAPAVGDVDNDGSPDILVRKQTGLELYRSSGVLMPEFSFHYESIGNTPGYQTPRLADLEGDGFLEVIDDQIFLPPDSVVRQVHAVLDRFGRPLPGWPDTTMGSVRSYSIPLDVDLDGTCEIYYNTGSMPDTWNWLVNLENHPLPGWPWSPPDANFAACSPIAGDLDGDGTIEILHSGNAQPPEIWWLRPDGTEPDGFPFPADLFVNETAFAAGDPDGDGQTEVFHVTLEGLLYGYRIPGEWHPERMFWNMDGNGPGHQGLYRQPASWDIPAVPDQGMRALPVGLALSVWPNPTNGAVRVLGGFPGGGESSLRLYNVAGRMVLRSTLFLPPGGSLTTVFDLDRLASGTYYLMLTSPRGRVTRPVILLR